MAHQYLGQAKDAVREAVFGNAGSMIVFRVGGPDGEALEKVFRPDMMRIHLLNLQKHEVVASIQEGKSRPVPFLGVTLAPVSYPAGRKDAIIALSRERYARPRSKVESRASMSCSLTMMQGKARHNGGRCSPEISPAHPLTLTA
jgi:hypothetical protein